MGDVRAISVTQLARRIRNLLEIEVGEVWVEGEVSNLRKQGSGHWYFSLKDESAQISCAMFGARRRRGHDVLEDGVKVQLFGEASFYEARGSTQLIVQKVQAVGVGDLQARFEALKKKLEKEGLFSSERKRPLPDFPKVVGLVTSPSGAALQDIMNVLTRRAPWLTVVLFPASVQGRGAERGIAAAIARAGRAGEEGLPQPEVLIVGRGGGSLEDLWNFNEEVVARAIANCPIPIVSAVGHEIDFTIADFVSDLRAPTPSAAAELVVPDQVELSERVKVLGRRLDRVVKGRVDRWSEQLDFYERSLFGQAPERILQGPIYRLEGLRRDFLAGVRQEMQQRERMVEDYLANWKRYHPREVLKRRQEKLDRVWRHLTEVFGHSFEQRKLRLDALASLLQALGPDSILNRGFSVAFGPDGKVLKSKGMVEAGDRVRIRVSDGEIRTVVEKAEP